MQTWRKIVHGIRPNSAALAMNIVSLQNLRNVSSEHPRYSFTEETVKVPRTSLQSPKNHTEAQIGMWYTIDPDMTHRLYHFWGLNKKTKELNEIFRETSFMIREPAVQIMEYIRRSNLAHPINKYILYGRHGTGKSMTLAHLVHHFVDEGWIIVHAGAPVRWLTGFKEILASTTREGFFDHTLDASQWLQHFKQQNGTRLEDPNLVTTDRYDFTRREFIEKGSPLMSLIDFGIKRSRYGSEVIISLAAELKNCCRNSSAKVAVIIDGVNVLFSPATHFRLPDRTMVPACQFTMIQAFLSLLENDWNNGVVVGSVDKGVSTLDRRKSHLPRYLLGKKGWELLEPFVPIQTTTYTDREFESAVNYYLDRQWIQHPAGRTREGKDELSFISGNNPLELIEAVNYL